MSASIVGVLAETGDPGCEHDEVAAVGESHPGAVDRLVRDPGRRELVGVEPARHAAERRRDELDVAAGRELGGRVVGGAARLTGAAAADEDPAVDDALGRVLRHRQDPEHRDPGRQEPVERSVDHVADRTVRVAHDRLHVADGAEKVAAVDREGAAEPDDEVLGEVGHPDHLVRDDLADRHDQVPWVEQELIDLDRDRSRHPPGRHRRDLLGADLAEPHESFAPPVLENASEGDPVSEEQVRLVRRHRRMGAERG